MSGLSHFILKDDHVWNRLLSQIAEVKPSVYTGPLLEVIIKPWEKKRSEESNNYYWAVIVDPTASFCGYSKDAMHDEFLGSYFGWVEKELRGHIRQYPRRTTTTNEEGERDVLPKHEMQNYIEHCKAIQSELGVPLVAYADQA